MSTIRDIFESYYLKYRHFFRFLVVGGTNTAVDFTIYFLLANIVTIYPVTASIISTGITMCLSFFLNHWFVFKSQKKRLHTVVQFFTVTAFNVWVVQSLIIAAIIHSLDQTSLFVDHVWSLNLLAKLAGISVSLVLNFVMYRYIFHQKKVES